MNYLNRLVLKFKTIPIYDLLIIFTTIFVIIASFFLEIEFSLSTNLQYLFLIVFVVLLYCLYRMDMPALKISVFNFKLKIDSFYFVKFKIIFKVFFYGFAFIHIIKVSNVLSDMNFNIFTVIFLLLCFRATLTNRNLYRDVLITISVVFLVLMKFQFSFIYLLFSIIYIFSNWIEVDFLDLYNHSIIYNGFLDSKYQNELYTLQRKTNNKKIISVRNIYDYLFIKMIDLIKCTFIFLIGIIVILLIIKELKISLNNEVYSILLIYIYLNTLMELNTKEELKLYNAKVISNKLLKKIILYTFLGSIFLSLFLLLILFFASIISFSIFRIISIVIIFVYQYVKIFKSKTLKTLFLDSIIITIIFFLCS